MPAGAPAGRMPAPRTGLIRFPLFRTSLFRDFHLHEASAPPTRVVLPHADRFQTQERVPAQRGLLRGDDLDFRRLQLALERDAAGLEALHSARRDQLGEDFADEAVLALHP